MLTGLALLKGKWAPGPNAYWRRLDEGGSSPVAVAEEPVTEFGRRRRELTYRPDPNQVKLQREVREEFIRNRQGLWPDKPWSGDPEACKQKVRDTLRQLAAGPVVIRATPYDAETILIAGEFDNQFETHTSGGAYNPQYRVIAEARGLGVPFDADPSERPIYGYIETRPDDAWGYGAVRFYLKDSVKARTTMTVGDSLAPFGAREMVASPVTSPDLECIGVEHIERILRGEQVLPPGAYVEAQIQGDVHMSDVERIVVELGVPGVQSSLDRIRELARSHGIPVEVTEAPRWALQKRSPSLLAVFRNHEGVLAGIDPGKSLEEDPPCYLWDPERPWLAPVFLESVQALWKWGPWEEIEAPELHDLADAEDLDAEDLMQNVRVEVEGRFLVPVDKAQTAKRVTYGVVLEPGVEDLQGDILTPEDIEEAAYDWMERSQAGGYMHSELVPGAAVVESYIAPCDIPVDTAEGTEIIRKGSWVLAMRWPEEIWERIQKGELTGYSIGGVGVRVPLDEVEKGNWAPGPNAYWRRLDEGGDDEAESARGRYVCREVPPEKFVGFRERSKRPGFLTKYTAAEYRQMGAKCYKLEGIDAGYAIYPDPDNDNKLTLISLHNNDPTVHGLCQVLVQDAIRRGARALDCYDGFLRERYQEVGFREVKREPWKDEYAPEDWDYNRDNRPDVVWMELAMQKAVQRTLDSKASSGFTFEEACRMINFEPTWDVEEESKRALVNCVWRFTQGGRVPLKEQDANRIRAEFEMFG